MSQFNVPTREEVSEKNQVIFDNLKKAVGFVPNIYATLAHSETALTNYLPFEGARSSLTKKEGEIVNLVTSQINGCRYCLSAHTAIGKLNGFTDEQILELRQGFLSDNEKYNILAKTTKQLVLNRGKLSETEIENFLNAGYTKGTLVDIILAINAVSVTNFLHNLTQVPIDFPVAPELEAVTA